MKRPDFYDLTLRGPFIRCTPWGYWCVVDNLVYMARHLPIWGGARRYVRIYDAVERWHNARNEHAIGKRHPEWFEED